MNVKQENSIRKPLPSPRQDFETQPERRVAVELATIVHGLTMVFIDKLARKKHGKQDFLPPL